MNFIYQVAIAPLDYSGWKEEELYEEALLPNPAFTSEEAAKNFVHYDIHTELSEVDPNEPPVRVEWIWVANQEYWEFECHETGVCYRVHRLPIFSSMKQRLEYFGVKEGINASQNA